MVKRSTGVKAPNKENCHSISENTKLNYLRTISRDEDEVTYLSCKNVMSFKNYCVWQKSNN